MTENFCFLNNLNRWNLWRIQPLWLTELILDSVNVAKSNSIAVRSKKKKTDPYLMMHTHTHTHNAQCSYQIVNTVDFKGFKTSHEKFIRRFESTLKICWVFRQWRVMLIFVWCIIKNFESRKHVLTPSELISNRYRILRNGSTIDFIYKN